MQLRAISPCMGKPRGVASCNTSFRAALFNYRSFRVLLYSSSWREFLFFAVSFFIFVIHRGGWREYGKPLNGLTRMA